MHRAAAALGDARRSVQRCVVREVPSRMSVGQLSLPAPVRKCSQIRFSFGLLPGVQLCLSFPLQLLQNQSRCASQLKELVLKCFTACRTLLSHCLPLCILYFILYSHVLSIIPMFYPSFPCFIHSNSFFCEFWRSFSPLVTGSPWWGVAVKRIIAINRLINYQQNQLRHHSVASPERKLCGFNAAAWTRQVLCSTTAVGQEGVELWGWSLLLCQ